MINKIFVSVCQINSCLLNCDVAGKKFAPLQNDQAKKDKLLMQKIQTKGFSFLFEKKGVLFKRSVEISGEWYG